MPTAIGYRSYMVRLWYSTEQADPIQVVIPASDDADVPQWLTRALAGEPIEEQRPESASASQEPLLFHAEVEHVQSGERRSFDTMDGLLEFLRGLTAEA
jgi:hypothetical protein